MYLKDVLRIKYTKSTNFKTIKFPLFVAGGTAVLAFAYVNVNLIVYRSPILKALLILAFIVIELLYLLTVVRVVLVEEKKKLAVINSETKSTFVKTIKPFSKLDLREEKITYKFRGHELYTPEVEGKKSIYIKLDHKSKISEENSKAMLREIHNYALSNNIVYDYYCMPCDVADFECLKNEEARIKNLEGFTTLAMERASARYEYQTIISEHNTAVYDIIRLTALNWKSNMNFITHVKHVIVVIDRFNLNYKMSILDKEGITHFLKHFFRLKFLDMSSATINEVRQSIKKSIKLHRVVLDDGECVDFLPISIDGKGGHYYE